MFSSFQQLTVNMFTIKSSIDRIPTADLWYRKRPLCQLSHNHCLSSFLLQVDKLIDLAAPPPKGTGVQNIREIIIEAKMTFDVSADEWQAYLKEKIMNNIERLFRIVEQMFLIYCLLGVNEDQ